MPRYVRFSGLLLTAALLASGCTSSPHPVAGADAVAASNSATGSASASLSASGSQSTSASAKPRPSKTAATPKATPKATASATPSPSDTPSPTTTPSPSATTPKPTVTPTHTATPSPTAAAPKPPADPIVAGAYVFPIVGCSVSYGSSHHDYPATDMFAGRGCHFVAATSGTVDEVGYSDKWKSSTNLGADRGGLFVSIVGDDGVRYYGSHLTSIAPGIAPGVTVNAGDLLGFVGNTGDARGIGTHVHFGISWPTTGGIWWVRRGWVSPYSYLNSWRGGVGRSPSAAVAAAHAANGDVPKCHADC